MLDEIQGHLEMEIEGSLEIGGVGPGLAPRKPELWVGSEQD
jgi:hypothetical protein